MKANIIRMKITVIDSRDPLKTRRKVCWVRILRTVETGFLFESDWQFPVPAHLRRYFSEEREIAVEELGETPKRKGFRFFASYV